MIWEEFQRTWTPDPQPELNADLRKWARLLLTPMNTPKEVRESTPILQGTLWNVGFVPEGRDLSSMPVNWVDVDAALQFITGVTPDLTSHGCVHSSMTDTELN